ncbi:MAG: deaminase [Patescibacteria group bacterium]|nr:hypothetical protein [Patescibacteria group bacterium]
MKERDYLKLAIQKAEDSSRKGLFPAGALVVKADRVVSSTVSAVFPDYKHSESKAVDEAFEKLGKSLKGCTLYCSLEPCLMCLTRAYWAGIRRVVYACRRNAVSQYYFEGINHIGSIIQSFNEKLELVYYQNLEKSSLSVVRTWEQGRVVGM